MSLSEADLSGYDTPGRGLGIFDAFRRHFLLRLLVRQGTATRYRHSVLGWTWSYLKPGMQMVIFYFVMGIILGMNTTIDHFAVYMFAGIVLMNLFNEAFGNATRSILENGALVQKIYLPRELFPLATVIVALVHFLPQVAILFVVCLLVGWHFSLMAVACFLAGVGLMASFALGLGMMFGGVNVRYRDSQNFAEIISMFSVWSAPALYQWDRVANALPAWFLHIYLCNPLAIAVILFHRAFWQPTTNQPMLLPEHFSMYATVSVVVTLGCLALGQLSFRHFEKTFAQDL